ncbi:M14 family metallopeptidase [Mucilaginibacter sp. PAMB04168]|uniref:M14 family metallopeptidase n=1 Tax=Mucilaginibacter sp. PAMB04168 TaxID=3138567 RepID=UPI0031F70C5E
MSTSDKKWIYFTVLGFCVLYACTITKKVEATRVINKAVIEMQARKTFDFDAVHFSNQFATARANDVLQQDDSTFAILIKPENTPVNPSPWYAFKVWGKAGKRITIILNYANVKHRYNPKISYQAKVWTDIGRVTLSRDSTQASFKLNLTGDTALIAAQEIISSANSYAWMDSLARSPFIKKYVIGNSLLGNPIVALTTTNDDGKKLVVVLSRQHPPEVTGYMAMQAFVNSVTGNTPLAQAFRKQYRLVLIPLLNPDGVDEGNWRHSAAGVDLNRDWDAFKQPETQAAKQFLTKMVAHEDAKVYFGIDFHSTYHDVFYTNIDTLHTTVPGFTNKWLNAFQQAIPGFKARVQASGNGGNVSKSWMMRALGTDAITYEVGDNTSRQMLQNKGRVAAEKMMDLLLKDNRRGKE